MSLSVKIDGVEYASTRVRLRANGEQGITGLSSAADGTGSQGGIVLDDPRGEVVLREWMEVIVEETDCIEAPRLFTGYIADYTERRGKYRDGPGREIDITINDQNCLLSLRNLTGGDTNRPKETDTQRLDWLIHSDYLDGIVFDTGFINGADRSFDAEDLHGQFPAEVIGNLCGPRGQSFFAFFDQEARKVSLFYDAPTATTLTSALSVSNVLADVGPIDGPDTTCFFPYIDAERNSSGEDLADNIRYKYKGGVAYRTNPTTQATYFPEPLRHRGINVQNDLVGLRTTAITFADRILAARSTPIVVVTFTLRLPARKVGWVDAGYRLPIKFSHLTGFSDFTYTRVETKALTQTDGRRDYYDVSLTCSLNGYRGPTTGSGGVPGTDPFPTQPPPPPVNFYSGSLSTTTERVGVAASSLVGGSIAGWTNDNTLASTNTALVTLLDGETYDVDVRFVVDAQDIPTGTKTWGIANNFSGEHFKFQFDSPGFGPGGVDPGGTVHWVGSVTMPAGLGDFTGCLVASQPGEGHGVRGMLVEWTINPVGWDDGTALDPPGSGSPSPTGEVPTPTPDGTETVFRTANAYAVGSLHVSMNGIELVRDVDFFETDPSCGEFTFAQAPAAGAEILVWYVVS